MRRAVKRVVVALVSVEVCAYGLSFVQALGITMPALVPTHLASGKATCPENVERILRAATEWERLHPGKTLTSLSDLSSEFHDLPRCPDGGEYALVGSGQSLTLANGMLAVVPYGRVGVRCVHTDGPLHYGAVENPFFGRPARFLGWGGNQFTVERNPVPAMQTGS